jgi:hypothetical protein
MEMAQYRGFFVLLADALPSTEDSYSVEEFLIKV